MYRIEVDEEQMNAMEVGTTFAFETWDSDDYTYWTLHYTKRANDQYEYLGGGMDNGSAVGLIYPVEKIIYDINNNDFPGFEIIS